MIDIKNLRFTFELSSTLGDVLYLLLTEKLVSTEDLRAVCSNPRVAMYRLRQVLTPLGVDVNIRRDLGYWMSEEDKQAIITIATSPETPPPPEETTRADA